MPIYYCTQKNPRMTLMMFSEKRNGKKTQLKGKGAKTLPRNTSDGVRKKKIPSSLGRFVSRVLISIMRRK